MTYYHWAAHPVTLRQQSYQQFDHLKPNGLWFDANGAWRRWCESVQFRLESLRYRHTVVLVDASRILFLKSASDIDAFTEEYGLSFSGSIQLLQDPDDADAFTRNYGTNLFSEIQKQFSNCIRWEEVAARHSGIVIAPFLRSRSLTCSWYYGWNCAGGCVWDTSVIRLGRPRRMDDEPS